MAPCLSAQVPRFDAYMLRMFLSDSPAESKSSWQMEAIDTRNILTDVTEKSLVLVSGFLISKGFVKRSFIRTYVVRIVFGQCCGVQEQLADGCDRHTFYSHGFEGEEPGVGK
jgi:hypothetical protein